jgi:hypothetical protein
VKTIQLVAGVGVLALAFWGGAKACAKTEHTDRVVPKIVTVFDTVEKRPEWLDDSIKTWKKRSKPTVNVITETVIDTEFVPVNAPAEERPNIWPLLSLHGGRQWGDTLFTRTFSVKDGHEGVSTIFSTGYITDIEIDSTPTPRITFTEFPPSEKHGFWFAPKVFGVGLATGTLVCLAFCR